MFEPSKFARQFKFYRLDTQRNSRCNVPNGGSMSAKIQIHILQPNFAQKLTFVLYGNQYFRYIYIYIYGKYLYIYGIYVLANKNLIQLVRSYLSQPAHICLY